MIALWNKNIPNPKLTRNFMYSKNPAPRTFIALEARTTYSGELGEDRRAVAFSATIGAKDMY